MTTPLQNVNWSIIHTLLDAAERASNDNDDKGYRDIAVTVLGICIRSRHSTVLTPTPTALVAPSLSQTSPARKSPRPAAGEVSFWKVGSNKYVKNCEACRRILPLGAPHFQRAEEVGEGHAWCPYCADPTWRDLPKVAEHWRHWQRQVQASIAPAPLAAPPAPALRPAAPTPADPYGADNDDDDNEAIKFMRLVAGK
jgi:hypothetical protein